MAAPKFNRGQARAQDVTVSDFVFKIGILEPMQALALEHELKDALLPALSEAVGGAAGTIQSLMGMKGEALGAMLSKLSKGVSEQLTRRVLEALCEVSQVQDDTGAFFDLKNIVVRNDVFRGAPMLVYQFIWAGLKVNYADYLKGFQGVDLSRLMAAAQAETSESPSTSNGDG